MSLLTEASALNATEPYCLVGRWEQTLDKATRAELDEAIGSTLPLSVVFQALVNRNSPAVTFSLDRFTRHCNYKRGTRRVCSCRS